MVIVGIGDIGIRHGHMMLLHRGHIGQRSGGAHAVQAGEATFAIGVRNNLASGVSRRAVGADLWRDIGMAHEHVIPTVPAWLVGQRIRYSGVGSRTQRIALCAVNANADKISRSLVGIALDFLFLWRISTEDSWDIGGGILQFDIRRDSGTNVAASAGIGHPWGGRVLALGGQHIIRCIGWRRWGVVLNGIGPVGGRETRSSGA